MIKKILAVSLIILTMVYQLVASRIDNGKEFIVSSYCLTTKMANGKRPYYGVISADPRVLPLGTIVEIMNQKFIVSDTGGKIKNNRIDLWLPSCGQSKKFGVKKMIIKIVK